MTETSSSHILEAKNISKTFHHPIRLQILSDVSFAIEKGRSAAIMGASGEGKSTLLHILGTLDKASSGDIYIAGKDISKHSHAPIRNKHIGFIFQAYNLLSEYTTLENVLMPARIGGLPTSKNSGLYTRALALLDQVGLSSRHHFLTKLLSGGEQQRVAIARALCNDPDIILADEPSGNLDHKTSQSIHRCLLETTQNQGKALVVVTHDQELAHLCDKRYLLLEGKLHEQ